MIVVMNLVGVGILVAARRRSSLLTETGSEMKQLLSPMRWCSRH